MAITYAPRNIRCYFPDFTNRQGNNLAFSSEVSLTASGHYASFIVRAEQAMTPASFGMHLGALSASGACNLDIFLETVGSSGERTGTLLAAGATVRTGLLAGVGNAWYGLFNFTTPPSIARGDIFNIVLAYFAGTSIAVQRLNGPSMNGTNGPYGYNNVGTPAKASTMMRPWGLFADANTPYFVEGLLPCTTITNGTFNSSTAAGIKRGMLFTAEFSGRLIGFVLAPGTALGNYKAYLYDAAGTTVLAESAVVDGDQQMNVSTGPQKLPAQADYEFTRGTQYRVVVEPQAAVNIALDTVTLGASATAGASWRSAWPHGTNAQYTEYATSGGWVDTNTGIVPNIGIIYNPVAAPDAAGGGGGSVFGSRGGVLS